MNMRKFIVKNHLLAIPKGSILSKCEEVEEYWCKTIENNYYTYDASFVESNTSFFKEITEPDPSQIEYLKDFIERQKKEIEQLKSLMSVQLDMHDKLKAADKEIEQLRKVMERAAFLCCLPHKSEDILEAQVLLDNALAGLR